MKILLAVRIFVIYEQVDDMYATFFVLHLG